MTNSNVFKIGEEPESQLVEDLGELEEGWTEGRRGGEGRWRGGVG